VYHRGCSSDASKGSALQLLSCLVQCSFTYVYIDRISPPRILGRSHFALKHPPLQCSMLIYSPHLMTAKYRFPQSYLSPPVTPLYPVSLLLSLHSILSPSSCHSTLSCLPPLVASRISISSETILTAGSNPLQRSVYPMRALPACHRATQKSISALSVMGMAVGTGMGCLQFKRVRAEPVLWAR
jgi:hypothetical protein